MRAELLHFYDSYYSANNMKLCVVGRESLADMRRMVTDKFSAVPNKDLPVPAWEGSPWTGAGLPYEVQLKPVKDSRSVSLIFPLPWAATEHWRSKPSGYHPPPLPPLSPLQQPKP